MGKLWWCKISFRYNSKKKLRRALDQYDNATESITFGGGQSCG